MNVVIYARVSSIEQFKGYSIDAQVDECRAWAQAKGYTIVNIYIEPGQSAKSDERPEFRRMIKQITHGQVGAIIVHKFDRFARNLLDLLRYKKMLRDHGAAIYSATEEFFNGDSPENDLAIMIMGATAEYVGRNIGLEAKKGLAAKAKAGHWPGSLVKLGYIRVGQKREARIEICPEKGPMIRQAFSEFATGRYNLRQWVDHAKAAGYHNHQGKPLSRAGWQRIFRSIFYLGNFEWQSQEYEGVHPPLIDRQTWQQVQDVLDRRSSGGSQTRHFWLLKDLLWSTVHQKPMTGNLAKNKIPYYRAKGRKRLDPTEHNIRAEDAHAQIPILLEDIRATDPTLAPDEWRLALLASPHLDLIYPHIPTPQARRAFLHLIFLRHGLHINRAGRLSIYGLKPGFELIHK